MRRALCELKRQLPTGRPLSGVQIVAQGERIVVRQGGEIWNPESGQRQFDFDVSELADKVTPAACEALDEARQSETQLDAEDWFKLGTELEVPAPEEAREAYRRALELEPAHVDARINLGRLLHEARQLNAAESHYRLALADRPKDSTALFNLGVVLEDLERPGEAVVAYRKTIEIDPSCADAYFNLARLFERAGDSQAALRYLKIYRKLTGQ